MKYTEFKKLLSAELLLLLYMDAIDYSAHLFELDNYPDFDLSEYNKHAEGTYFFSNDLEFPAHFSTVIRIDSEQVRLFTSNDIERLSMEYQTPITPSKSHIEFLREIHTTQQELLNEGVEPDFDGCRFNSVKTAGINNINKTISVQGGYSADSGWIQPYDCHFILFCNILGIPNTATQDKLHLSLIAEGYSLIASGNFGLSFSIIYTAIECYINAELNAHDEQIRLNDKIQKLFKKKFTPEDVGTHQIYTSIIGEFSNHTDKRNKIAHGKTTIRPTESDAREILLFSLILIASLESRISTFKDLKDAITNGLKARRVDNGAALSTIATGG